MAKTRTIFQISHISPKFIIVLAVLGIIGFYIFTFFISLFFDIGSFRVPVQEAFFLISLGVPIILSYYMIDKPPHFTTWEILMILIVFLLNIFILTIVAPKLVPAVFATPASVLGAGINSVLGW